MGGQSSLSPKRTRTMTKPISLEEITMNDLDIFVKELEDKIKNDYMNELREKFL